MNAARTLPGLGQVTQRSLELSSRPRRPGRSRRGRSRSTYGRTRAAAGGRTSARTTRARRVHCAGRSVSPASSHAVSSVQQTSANVSSDACSPLVTAAIASSSRSSPSSTFPPETSASPSCASARSSRSASPSRAGHVDRRRGRAPPTPRDPSTLRARELEPASLRPRRDHVAAGAPPARASRSRPPCSPTRARTRATATARSAPRAQARPRAESRRTRAPGRRRPRRGSRSHHNDRPRPSSDSGSSETSTIRSKRSRASVHSPARSAARASRA